MFKFNKLVLSYDDFKEKVLFTKAALVIIKESCKDDSEKGLLDDAKSLGVNIF